MRHKIRSSSCFWHLLLLSPAVVLSQEPSKAAEAELTLIKCQANQFQGAMWGKPSGCQPGPGTSLDPIDIDLPTPPPADIADEPSDASDNDLSSFLSTEQSFVEGPAYIAPSMAPPPANICKSGEVGVTSVLGGLPLQGSFFTFNCATITAYVDSIQLLSTGSLETTVLDAILLNCNDGSAVQFYTSAFDSSTDVETDTPANTEFNSVSIYSAPGYPVTGIEFGTLEDGYSMAGGSNSPNGTAPMQNYVYDTMPANSRITGIQGTYDTYFNSIGFSYTCT